MPADLSEPFISAPDADLEPAGPLAGAAPGDPSVADGNPLPVSDLARLVDEITADVAVPLLKLKIEGRPGWGVHFRTDVVEDDLDKFGKLADRKRKAGGAKRPRVGIGAPETDVSEARMSALLLSAYNVAIVRRGQPLVDDDGDPLTLRSPELHRLLEVNAGDPYPSATAVRKIYGGLEGQIIAAGRALLAAAGYLSEPDEDDDDPEREPGPTTG